MRSLKVFAAVIAASLALLLCTCTPHISMQAKAMPVPAGATIGVLVDLPWGQSTNNDLAAFMSAALIKKGFHVKSINPNDLIPQGVWGRISNDQDKRYAFIEALATMIQNGGKLKGDKEMWKKLMEVNEIKEASLRFTDLNALVDEFIKRWDTEFIMFITPSFNAKTYTINPHDYLVKVLRIKDRETIFVYYIQSNESNFQEKIPSPGDVEVSFESKNSTEFKMIKFCSYIAGMIQ
jgi:hypothetical protein